MEKQLLSPCPCFPTLSQCLGVVGRTQKQRPARLELDGTHAFFDRKEKHYSKIWQLCLTDNIDGLSNIPRGTCFCIVLNIRQRSNLETV